MAVSLGGTAFSYFSSPLQTASASFSADPTAGATIIVGSHHFVSADSSNVVSSVTDNAGNTYSLVPNTRRYAGGLYLDIWYAYNVSTTSGLLVTVNYSHPNQTARGVRACIVEGADTSNPLDLSSGSIQSNSQTSTDWVTTGNIGTPSTDGQFIYSMLVSSYAPDNIFPGTGYTGLGSYIYNSNEYSEYRIQGTAAPVAATYTIDFGGGTIVTSAITIKAAGGGGGGGGSSLYSPTRIYPGGNVPMTLNMQGQNKFRFING